MTAPSVFVSSTIHDFGDLRSALKHWLEELGYEPRFSEHNDFPKPLDEDSYSACLAAIDSSDYFVLLIGARRGGMFDAEISITRAEYRRAYERFAATGRPRILSFVRRSVLDVKEDRKAIGKALATDPAKAIVDATGSIIADNPIDIFAFIDEVKRVEEMKAATAKGAARPPGNWVHDFVGFRDVVNVLRGEFGMRGSLRRAGLAANLRHELLENATRLLTSGRKNGIHATVAYSDGVHARFRGGMDDKAVYTRGELAQLWLFIAAGKVGSQFATHALSEAITSTEFMEWDPGAQRYRVGSFQRTLLALRGEIEALARFEIPQGLQNVFDHVHRTRGENDRTWELDNGTVGFGILMRILHLNIARLLGALLIALDTDASEVAEPRLESRRLFSPEEEAPPSIDHSVAGFYVTDEHRKAMSDGKEE